ncbi:hypothetical protein HYW83_01385 [Candidatus Peregrinibacteria bacterium]|nr:hypothetical protein [Candidatus Peregrinibacteria bacterium]
MANKKSANGHKPATKLDLNKALKPILDKLIKHDKRFEQIDRRFDVVETRLEMNDRRFIGLNARVEALEKAVHNLDEKFDDYFTKMYSHIDTFMKRTETNALEITLLGKQHDDLAKYCTEKIGYPVYGRNL